MKKIKVLVLEDEALIALDIRYELEAMGYEVTDVVSNSKDAFESVEKNRPDIALLDVNVRGLLNGADIGAQLKVRYDVPCIFLTAYVDENTIEQVKRCQPYGYMVKPLNIPQLRATLETSIAKIKLEKRQAVITTKAQSIPGWKLPAV